MRAVAIIQARMGSTRLPGKVMLPIGGKTMLERVCDQVARIEGLDDWVVVVPEDDAKFVHAPRRFLGPISPLGRYVMAARHLNAQIIMRITADCPLLDETVASQLLDEFRQDPGLGYLSNVRPRRLNPDGCDVEMFTRGILEGRFEAVRTPEEWEHVTTGMPATWVPKSIPPLLESRRAGPTTYYGPEIIPERDFRWTVDTAEDLEFVREVYRGLEARHLPVSIGNVLSLTPGDACEHCAAKVPHLTREGKTNWALHQVSVEDGMRLPGGWPNYPAWARTKADGRIFVACEAWEMAKVGGTRRCQRAS